MGLRLPGTTRRWIERGRRHHDGVRKAGPGERL